MRFIVLIFCCLKVLFSYSQDIKVFKEDLLKASNFLAKNDKVAVNVYVEQYMSHSPNIPVNLGKGEMRKIGFCYYTFFDKKEMICIQDKTLKVDHHSRTITLSPPQNVSELEIAQLPEFINSLEKIRDLKVEENGNGNVCYTYSQPQALIERVKIEIDAKTGFYRSIEYYYAQDPENPEQGTYKVRINYEQSKDQLKTDIFQASKYIQKSGSGSYQTTPEFKNYRLRFSNYQKTLEP